MHQRINLRHGYAPGRVFGSIAEREAYIDRFEAARTLAFSRGRRYVMAPDQALVTCDGRALCEGDEVTVTDFAFTREHIPGETLREIAGWQRLAAAVRDGRVIDSGFEPEPPRAA